jgi:hypothetical protein
MESYLDGTGYNTYGNQYPEMENWILRGDTKLSILVSQLDSEKKFKFQTLLNMFDNELTNLSCLNLPN